MSFGRGVLKTAASTVLVVLAIVIPTNAMECYECNSLLDDDCTDLLNKTATDSYKQECKESFPICCKIVTKRISTGYVIVERDCCKRDVCDREAEDDTKISFCGTCKKPLCNNGNSLNNVSTKYERMKLALISLAIVAMKLNGI